MAEHNDLGKWGEQVAREILLSQGYAIVGENVHVGRVEIDLIATKDNRICFVEVKTRHNDFIDPISAVDQRKRARIVRAANAYMQGVTLPLEPQFDLIFIIGNPDRYTVEHIPDAFYPPLNGR